MTEALDWQSEQVGDKLIGALLKALHSWLDNHGLITRLSHDRLRQHLASALDFVGEKADGYLMARFLEDNRSWPANQELCAILATTAALRERVIKQLQREAIEAPAFDEDGFYPAGTRFGHGAMFYSVQSKPSLDFDGVRRYRVVNLENGSLHYAAIDLVHKAVQDYYERQQAVDEDIFAF